MTMRAYTSEWWIASKHDTRRGLWYREEGGVQICTTTTLGNEVLGFELLLELREPRLGLGGLVGRQLKCRGDKFGQPNQIGGAAEINIQSGGDLFRISK